METRKLMGEKSMKNLFKLAALCAGLLLTACSTGTHGLYQWGSYEDQVYAMYNSAEKTSPQEQLAKLEADGEKARAGNRTPPPAQVLKNGGANVYVGLGGMCVAQYFARVGAIQVIKQCALTMRVECGPSFSAECESADTFDIWLTYSTPIKINVVADEVGGIGGQLEAGSWWAIDQLFIQYMVGCERT
jgi:hypothetical protein